MRRLSAGAAALLCVGLQLSGALHHLLVEHAHCLEHGELTHADGGHGQTHAGEPQVTGADPVASRTERHADAGHEHCPIASAPRGDLEAAPAAGSPVVTAPATCDAPTHDAAHAIAALLSAPKTSPPA